jgi:hypothetical protein
MNRPLPVRTCHSKRDIEAFVAKLKSHDVHTLIRLHVSRETLFTRTIYGSGMLEAAK